MNICIDNNLKKTDINQIINELKKSNNIYAINNQNKFKKHMNIQKPEIALVTCSDSRVIPELIFDKSIGDLFVVRVAGNIIIDPSVISSLEYSVEHLKIKLLIILGHTNCGAVKAAEESENKNGEMIDEIRKSFPLNNNHILSNLSRQIYMLPKRSSIISKSINQGTLHMVGAIYNLENGKVEFL